MSPRVRALSRRTKTFRLFFLSMLFLGLIPAVFLVWGELTIKNQPPLSARQKESIRIVIANLFFENTQMDQALSVVLNQEPDLAVLNEWTNQPGLRLLVKAKGFSIRFDDPRPGTHGQALISNARLKVTAARRIPLPGSKCRLPVVVAEIRTRGKGFCLFGVHAPPPHVCPGLTGRYIDWITSKIHGGRLKQDLGPAGKGLPMVVAGDFNALAWPPWIGLRSRLSPVGLVDSHSLLDHGPAPTWSFWTIGPKLFRIDAVYASPEIQVGSFQRFDLPGSDHCGLTVDLLVPG